MALTTFSDLVQEARERVKHDAIAAGLSDDPKPLRDGGTGATAYAEAVGVYLGFAIRQACRSHDHDLHLGLGSPTEVPSAKYVRQASHPNDLGLRRSESAFDAVG